MQRAVTYTGLCLCSANMQRAVTYSRVNEVKAMKRDLSDVKNKAEISRMISSQNEDTGLPSYNPKDGKPYERKNIANGYRNFNGGVK